MYEFSELEICGKRIFNVHFTGDLNRELLFKLISEMGDHEDKYPGNKLLADLTKVAKISIDFNDMKYITGHVKQNGKRTGKMAVVLGDDTARFLFAKLFIDLFNLFRPGQDKAFKYREQAIDWLCPETH